MAVTAAAAAVAAACSMVPHPPSSEPEIKSEIAISVGGGVVSEEGAQQEPPSLGEA